MKKLHWHLMKPPKGFCNISKNIHCGKVITDEYAGELICSKCGVVLEEKIPSYVQEPTKSDSDKILSQTMMAISNTKYIHSSTTIGNQKSFGTRDHTGVEIPSTTVESLNRLYKSGNIQKTSCPESQKGIVTGMVKLDGLIHKLNLSESIFLDTARIYKKAHAAGIARGRSIMGVLSACIYYSCKRSHIPRDMSEICDAANIKKNVLFSCYRKVVDLMESYCSEKIYEEDKNHNCTVYRKYVDDKDGDATVAKQRYIRCIPKIVSKLDLPQRICRQAADIILLQDECLLSGKNPNTVAATAIYIACINDRKYHSITQREVSKASGITEMSIRNISKKLITRT